MLPSSLGLMQQLTMNCNCSYKSSSLFISPTCRISPRNFLQKSVSVSPCTSHSALKMPSHHVKITHAPRSFTRPSAVADAAETEELETPVETEKLGVVVKPMEKPRLVLKFMWMENDIGLALDYVIPGHGTIPISPYYFWPRKDAWEELKVMLESKPWISQKQLIILLNQATDIINLWQQTTDDL